MTLSGFATVDDFTSSHQTAMEKALSQEIGQSATVTDVTDAGSGVVIVYHVYLVTSPDTADVLKAITQIAENETNFVSVVTQKFDDEDVATPSGFGVDAARAVETTKEVEDGKYFSKLAGKWQLCSKGKSPNENKDSCDLCPEGSYSTEGVCVECNEGETASALRDRCDQELDDPLYKQVRLYRLAYRLHLQFVICDLICDPTGLVLGRDRWSARCHRSSIRFSEHQEKGKGTSCKPWQEVHYLGGTRCPLWAGYL
jgi:hypothetical protein